MRGLGKSNRVYMDWLDRPKNYKDLYGILQLLQGSHLDNFPQKTLKLGRVAFHSLTFQFKCLDFQSNQNKKLAPVPPRFCNGLCKLLFYAAQISCMANLNICGPCLVLLHNLGRNVLKASQSFKTSQPASSILCSSISLVYFS